jgi:hypothetical protein
MHVAYILSGYAKGLGIVMKRGVADDIHAEEEKLWAP